MMMKGDGEKFWDWKSYYLYKMRHKDTKEEEKLILYATHTQKGFQMRFFLWVEMEILKRTQFILLISFLKN
jgi:hypothetical protein